jgi:hypothetical protein
MFSVAQPDIVAHICVMPSKRNIDMKKENIHILFLLQKRMTHKQRFKTIWLSLYHSQVTIIFFVISSLFINLFSWCWCLHSKALKCMAGGFCSYILHMYALCLHLCLHIISKEWVFNFNIFMQILNKV